MEKKRVKAVICMTTHDRVDCARINQEIISLNYKTPYPIVHACSDPNYQPYLEEVYVSCKPASLKEGAANLLKHAVAAAIKNFSFEYMIHLEGDTWIMREEVIHGLIRKMDHNPEFVLCTSAWDTDVLANAKSRRTGGVLLLKRMLAYPMRAVRIPLFVRDRDSLGTQFFIARNNNGLIDSILTLEPEENRELEHAFYQLFKKKFTSKNLLRLKEREIVHPHNRYVAEKLSLYTQHWPVRGSANDTRSPQHVLYISPELDGKKETLERYQDIRKGFFINKLLYSKSHDYYNPGASRV